MHEVKIIFEKVSWHVRESVRVNRRKKESVDRLKGGGRERGK
jgi:hypothetical protein